MKIAVWYHAKVAGWGIPDTQYAEKVVAEQMEVLKGSSLADAADEIHVGINGPNCQYVESLVPAKSIIYRHGDDVVTEIPTLDKLRSWLPGHDGWAVLYHHTKGVRHGGDCGQANWRNRMEACCVACWKRCVEDIAGKYDIAGCHYLVGVGGEHLGSPFFGGTFWWAKANYLMKLPPHRAAKWENRFWAEDWIGIVKHNAQNYWPGWP